MKKFGLMFSLIVGANIAVAGEWVEASLNQIELSPTSGWTSPEGVWFAKDVPYQTQYSCEKSRWIVVKDTKLADRALSVSLYAKSTGGKVKIYVTGCDAQGYLNGSLVMLVN